MSDKDLKKKLSEEEKEEKRVEKIKNDLRDQFKKEEKSSEVSKARGAKNYQTICKNFTLKRLSNEINATINTLNRLLDNHDVKTIERHRQHGEVQHKRLFAFHSRIVSCIFDLYKLFHNSMTLMYEDRRDRLVADFFEASVNQERIHHERRTGYGNLAHCNTSLILQRFKAWNEKLTNRRIEIESLSFIKREKMNDDKIERENFACQEIKSILLLFSQKLWPKLRLDEYQKVYLKDEKVNEDCKKINENIQKSLEVERELNILLNEAEYKKLLKMMEFKSEIYYLLKLLKLSENKIKDEEKIDKRKIESLVTVAEKTKQKIYARLEKIKRIESLVKICSKHEKLNDFIRNRSFHENHHEFHDEQQTSFFHNKLAQVESDCLVLKNENEELIKENQNLMKLISEKKHQHGLEYNYRILGLNANSSFENVHQIAHEIPQVKYEIMQRKLYQQHMKFYKK